MMLSWTERAQRRRRLVLFRPPAPHATTMGWHQVETHLGPMRLQFRPGIDIWKDVSGQRWTGEFASEHGWRWIAAEVAA